MPNLCFIIGKDTLLIACADILRQNDFQIKGIISSDQQIIHYCAENGLRYIDSNTTFAPVLEEEPFDYLFSITNEHILPESILRLPRHAAINYHDAPLPAYAGVQATFWALVNGEKTHGITWHVVDAGIDTGPILKQHRFAIEPDDTSIRLNITCYSAAVAAFRELVGELATGTLSSEPQDIARRSYVGRNKRPDTFLNWHHPAAQTARLVRALDFGFHPNPFGCLKIQTGHDFLLVKELSESTDYSPNQPGTILTIDADGLRVATGHGTLRIGALTTLAGEPVSVSVLCQQWGWTEGQVLSPPDPDLIQHYHQADRQCARYQAYWLEKLGRLSLTTLPLITSVYVDRTQKQPVDFMDVQLPSAIETALSALSETDDKTDRLLSAFLITVARLGNHRSVGVGYCSPVSRRMAVETSNLFADCLPFTIDFDWESAFDEATTAIRHERVTVDRHLTFARDWLVAQPALQPTVQALSDFNFPFVIHWMASGADLPIYKKALTLLITNESAFRIAYDATVWEASQVRDLVNRWLIVLENLTAYPAQPLKAVSLLTPAERQTMLVDWNATAVPYPRDQLVHQLVEAQVQQRPQTEALRCGTVALTYEQLNQRANRVARYLQKQGIQSDTVVGLCMDRSPDMIISLLAILKAGGAYVPLDPAYPATRLDELRRQTGVGFILTQQKWLDRLMTKEATCLPIDQEPAPWVAERTDNLNLPASADQLAYVLFTSGSTGRSKSVAIPHRGIVRLVKEANYARLDETVVMLGLAPLAFDASTLEVWGSLANGGRLVLVDDSQPTLEIIKQTIQRNQVNTTFFTAALFNVLVDSGIGELSTLTQLLTGGEAASAEHVRRAQRQLPLCTLINGYGPTESTTFASFCNLSATDWKTSSVPIGRPLSNTRLYIVDSFFNPVPVGIPGELLIGGDGLAREYLFQPELTEQQFIADPFTTQPGGRLYRTGDQARYLSDGTIEFLGRLDDQLKIRGFRIEPGEIEHSLCQHPAVGEAVVVAVELTRGHKALAAYLVPKSNAVLVPEAIRGFLQTKLPDHLIPTAFIPLTAMPLTGNGKVDKNRLPPAFLHSQNNEGKALTPTEVALMPLWSAVLNNPQSSRDDNFFDLGGSSLLAMQLLARIQQQFDRLLSMKDMFEHPTVRQLSTYLDQTLPVSPTRRAEPKPAKEPETESSAPLSFAQNRLWIIHQLHELAGTYNVPVVLTISGPLNPLVFRQSLAEISRRHQILRTTFGHTNGIPYQRIAPVDSVSTLANELVSVETGSLAHWLKTEAYQPFNLEEGPLVRLRIAQSGPDSWLILMVFHHLVYDGWSTRVLATEMSQLYPSLLHHQPASLPPLSIQYAEFARWQEEHSTPQVLQRELTYWKNRLAGAPFLLNLPIDKPRPAIQSFEGTDYPFHIPTDRWQPIRDGLQEPGTTVFLRLLTVFAVWLSRVTHTEDILVGIPMAGRNRPELGHSIGFFVNTVALRIRVSPDQTFRQVLRQVRQWTLEAYEHQDLPFEQVVDALKLPRNLAYTPLVQVIFDVQEDNTTDWQLEELSVESMPFEQHMAKFDLHLSFRETKEGVEGTFNYRSDLFTHQAIGRMTHDFLQLLNELAVGPDNPLGALPEQVIPQVTTPPVSPSARTTGSDRLNPTTIPQAVDSALVALLQPIWCWLLEVPTVELDDDFFDLGGHSLLAFQMTTELQRQTGHTIPVGSVFANPTIRQLATYLQTSHATPIWPSLVTVKPQGNKKPLFLMHPITGDIGYVYQLAAYLPDDQPVYGLRAVGLEGMAHPHASIEAMAAHYVGLIIDLQPNGPYALGGYSLGGVIAFEMAQQLRSLGKDVSLVALIDSYPVTPSESNPNQVPLGQVLHYYYNYWRSIPKRPRQLWQVIQQKAPIAGGFFLNRLWHRLSGSLQAVASQQTDLQLPELQSGLVVSNQQAYSRYTFKPYDGNVVLLRAAGKDSSADHRLTVTFGWNKYAQRGVAVHPIPGDHYSLFKNEATISRIAGILTSYLTA